jgi:hypothetical protein
MVEAVALTKVRLDPPTCTTADTSWQVEMEVPLMPVYLTPAHSLTLLQASKQSCKVLAVTAVRLAPARQFAAAPP